MSDFQLSMMDTDVNFTLQKNKNPPSSSFWWFTTCWVKF